MASEGSGLKATAAQRQREATKHDMATTERIQKLAEDAFEDEEKGWRWLHRPNIRTGNRPPIDLVGTAEGLQIVETILAQIKYAVYA